MQEFLAEILSLQIELRKQQTLKELAFFICHQTQLIFNYDKAFVWSCFNNKKINIESISGVVELELNTPLPNAMVKIISALSNQKQLTSDGSITQLSKKCLAQKTNYDLPEGLPNNLLFVPFVRDDDIIGGACFGLNINIDKANIEKLKLLTEAYQYSFNYLYTKHSGFSISSRKLLTKTNKLIAAMLLVFVMFGIKIPLSVMLEAEISAHDPIIVTAPMDGVIQTLNVHSEQVVNKGEKLFQMETKELLNQFQQAEKAYVVATETVNKVTRNSFNDLTLRSELKVLKSEKDEKFLAMNYAKTLLDKATMVAPFKAQVIVQDPIQWQGKPVQVGEKILELAKNADIEITLWLPVSEPIHVEKDDPITLYLNAHPLTPIKGVVAHSQYYAQQTAKDILAYKITGIIDYKAINTVLPKIGSQGVASVTHGKSTIFYYLFKRPITYLRQTIGW